MGIGSGQPHSPNRTLRVFVKDLPVKWYCHNCGYVSEGNAAPTKCPVCDHPQSYFEMWMENY